MTLLWSLPAGAAQPCCRGGAVGGHCAGFAAEAFQGSVSSFFLFFTPNLNKVWVSVFLLLVCRDGGRTVLVLTPGVPYMLSSSQTLSAEHEAPSRSNAAGSLQKTGGSIAGAA